MPPRLATFETLGEALDYAATAGTGMNFYSSATRLDAALTYAEIAATARDLATRLLGLGLSRGDRVGILADMNADFICLFFACQYAGLIAVPLPVITGLGGRQGYQQQLTSVLETCGAKAAFGPEPMLAYLRDAAEELPVDFIATAAALALQPASAAPLQPLRADEPSHIQYSSGSTRNPLGIEISQRALMANAQAIARDGVGFLPDDRVASWLPYYHDMGLIGCVIVPVTCQLTVDYLHTDSFARRPLQWLKIIADNRCTVSFSPTFGYDICARRAAGKADPALDLSCWRYAGIGGDMVQPEVFQHFAEVFAANGFSAMALTPSYGLAEATLAFSFGQPGRGIITDSVDKRTLADASRAIPPGPDAAAHAIRHFAACGAPMPGYSLQIRDAAGAELQDRQVGQVFIKGPSLMSGYFRNKPATMQCLAEDGWLNTGDMGYTIAGGLFVTGRSKDMMIVNGRNIWPQDMEWHAENNVAALRFRDTAAFAIEEDGRETPVILVQCRLLQGEDREALRREVHAAVFRNTGIDCRVELIPQRSLPFTTSGKLSRAKARDHWLRGDYNQAGVLASAAVAPGSSASKNADAANAAIDAVVDAALAC